LYDVLASMRRFFITAPSSLRLLRSAPGFFPVRLVSTSPPALAPPPSVDVYDLRREGAAIQVPKPPKRAAKVAAHVAMRLAVVRAGLASQEKRIADHKKTLPLKPRNQGLLYLIKKNAWEKGEGEE